MAESKYNVMPEETGRCSLIKSMVRPVLAEFVGTTILGFLVYLVPLQYIQIFGAVYGFAMLFLSVSLVIKGFSGGYFNPVITLGCVLAGTQPVLLAVGYLAAQLLGGISGAALFRGLCENGNSAFSIGLIVGGSDIGRTIGTDIGRTIGAGALMTFIVVLTVLTTVSNKENGHIAPLCIGLSVAVCSTAGLYIRAGLLNPAMDFGLAVAYSVENKHGDSLWGFHYISWVGPLLGAALASLLFRLLFASERRRIRLW